MNINLEDINSDMIKYNIKSVKCRRNPWLGDYKTNTLINQKIENIKKLSILQLIKEYGNLYIITITDSTNCDEDIFSKYIDENQYNEIKSKLVIRQVPFSLLKNEIIKHFLTLINFEDIPNQFIDNKGIKKEIASSDILVLSMLNISDIAINSYIKQYNGLTNISDIIQMLIVNDFLQTDVYSEHNKMIRYQMINNISEANYWTLNYNCKLNITLQFMARGFNLSLNHRIENKEIKDIINKISNKLEEDNDYLSHIFKKETYVDASINIKKEGYQLYRINNNGSILDKTEFDGIIDMCLNKKELYLMLTNILISKDYCHLVVNNSHILDKLQNKNIFNDDIRSSDLIENRSLLEKYTPLFSYLWSYAWLTLYLEESIKKSKIEETDRFVFDLETASNLPYFPSMPDCPETSPYLPMLVAETVLESKCNNLGIKPYCDVNRNLVPGVVNESQFEYRMNTFISGSHLKEYLKGIDWSTLALSGSIMAACLPKFNPLTLNFYENGAVNFNDFFNEYYGDADIDVMCNADKFEYIEKVYDFSKQLENNIKNNNNLTDNLFVVKITPIKTCAIMVNKEFITKYILPKTTMLLAEIIVNLHSLEVKQLFYEWYVLQKLNDNKNYIDKSEFINEKYNCYFELCKPEDMLIVIINSNNKKEKEKTYDVKSIVPSNLEENQVLIESIQQEGIIPEEDIEYETEFDSTVESNNEFCNLEEKFDDTDCVLFCNENLKFKISSPYLKHNFELFRIKYKSFFSTVARFHLPIVRAYYNGKKTFLLPTCISACMTMQNIDYKYFAGSKDPIEIINKYRSRGFGTYLNSKEKIRMIEYSAMVEKWKKLYGINIKNNNSVNQFFGYVWNDQNLFKPSKVLKNNNINYNEQSVKNSNLIDEKTIDDIYSKLFNGEFYNIEGIQRNIYKKSCININGYIKPLKKWMIEACYYEPIKQINTKNSIC
jgi:hypothetical protein